MKPENIVFEITETHNIADLENIVGLIKLYKAQGFSFAIDDFGTGFSSMQYLKRIPADYIKIDGSFIKDITENEQNFYLVKSLVLLAQAFNMKVVAEFVEDEKVLEKVKEAGIQFGQGYFFGRPDPSFNEKKEDK